jgi:hypothetical protein
MSSPDFQLALAQLIASPQHCVGALDDEAAFFAGYTLNEREQRRLRSVLRQEGLSACCTLYRMNRVTPIYMQLLNTCTVLGGEFIGLLEAFWSSHAATNMQFRDEVMAFGNFLSGKIRRGDLTIPYLPEILDLELALNELSYLPEGEHRVLKPGFDIFRILQLLDAGTLRQNIIEPTQLAYKIYLENNQLQIEPFRDLGTTA